jgi:hypothetical protein
VALIATLLLSDVALAYIPSSRTIFARTVKANGTGAYVIEQDVIFRSEAEPIALRERWTIASGEAMRVLVTPAPVSSTAGGPGVDARLDVAYRDGRRTGPDLAAGNEVRTASSPVEFFEPFSHFRSGRALADALLRTRIVPPQLFRERQPIRNLKDLKYSPEPFVQLVRRDGTINWSFGEPTPVAATQGNGALWIEQDVFAIRRLRFNTPASGDQAEIVYENDGTYAGGLRLARLRVVSWGRHSVEIRVVAVRSVNERQAIEQTSTISPAEARSARLPNLESVQQFYARFR